MWSVWQLGGSEGVEVTYYIRTPVGWVVTWQDAYGGGQKTMNAIIDNDIPTSGMKRVELHNPEQ